MIQALFFTRLFLYLLAFTMPVVHPSIPVPYDAAGWAMWFVLVPAEMLAAFYLAPPRARARTWIITSSAILGAILVFMVFMMGITGVLALAAGVGIAAFVLTVLVFGLGRGGTRIGTISVLEQFFLGFVYYKLLGFARADEEVARQSSGIAQAIFIIAIVAFLAHGIVLYLSMYRLGDRARGRRELFLFVSLIVPLVLFVVLVLPPDFVSHSVVFNRLNPEPEPQVIPLDERGHGAEDGNLRPDRSRPDGGNGEEGEGAEEGEGEEGRPREGQGRQGQLEGLPSGEWENRTTQEDGEGEGPPRQYAVMVVASPVDPVYVASSYFGVFDRVRGFIITPDEPLNDLTYRRLLETWSDPGVPLDALREEVPVFTLSTIGQRTLAYRPYRVEPTILNREYHPFSYSFEAISLMSRSDPQDWVLVEDLLPREREELLEYLEIPLSDPAKNLFLGYLDGIMARDAGYYARIDAILRGFSIFEYRIGFDDDVSVSKIMDFLSTTQSGDCTEFSNTTAILARLAGIPARVVVGYVASRDLQTPQHEQGLFILREMIEPLQRYEMEDLYLVTNMHHHSWVQLYMPGYGWVDFETTAFAIPPLGEGDPNAMNVVIPILDPQENLAERYPFPWLFVLKSLGVILGAVVVGLYLYRYGKQAWLSGCARREDIRGLRALRTLLFMRLAAEGYPLKSPAQTPAEYAEEYAEEQPGMQDFADAYTALRYRERFADEEKTLAWERLRRGYNAAMGGMRRTGAKALARRVFSLKGLYY